MLCIVCQNWVHRTCSDVTGSLTMQRTTTRHDASTVEGITVGSDTYEPLQAFCYLGDTMDANSGADSAILARVGSAWKHS